MKAEAAFVTCPDCGGQLEAREGPALAIHRRRKVSEATEDGPAIAEVPVTPAAWIIECLNLTAGCRFWMAGHLVDDHFLEDPDLVPMRVVLEKLLEYQEEQRRPHGDPGE